VKDQHSPRIFAVEDATRRFDDLTVTPAFELWRLRAKAREVFKMINMLEDLKHQLTCGLGIV
jgi:hypothetical protein